MRSFDFAQDPSTPRAVYPEQVLKKRVEGWVEGKNMDWTWNSPVALGLFLLMAGASLVLFGVAIALVSGKAKVSDLPILGLWRR